MNKKNIVIIFPISFSTLCIIFFNLVLKKIIILTELETYIIFLFLYCYGLFSIAFFLKYQFQNNVNKNGNGSNNNKEDEGVIH